MSAATLDRRPTRAPGSARGAAPGAVARPALRDLGHTGLRVSEIGFGTWGLGGNAYGRTDDAESIAVLRAAFDQGVTFYDTSDLYGDGHSERLLGQALGLVRDQVVIATKVGLLPHSSFEMPCDFSDAHILRGLDASLQRLGTDRVDLYLLHSPTLEMMERPGLWALLERLQREGRIGAFGLSARSPADALQALKRHPVQALQVNFNLIDQRALDTGLFDLAQQQGVGIIARTPLCFGYLTGKLSGHEALQKGLDHRANWPAAQLARWAQSPDLFSFLNDGQQRTPAQLALRYCLDHAAVATTIPGMLHERELRENLAACALPRLSDAEMGRIQDVYRSHSFYDPGAKQQGPAPAGQPTAASAAPAEAPQGAPAAAGAQAAHISADDWAAGFGLTAQALHPSLLAQLQAIDTRHQPLQAAQWESHLVQVLGRLNRPGAQRSTAENEAAFEAGWDENLRACREQGVSWATLRPGYVKPHAVVRWQGRLVQPANGFLADDLLRLAVRQAAHAHLSGVAELHEFGCGTGRFLFDLADQLPARRLVGLDWTRSSQAVLALIAATGRPVTGRRFDMLQPDAQHVLGAGAGVLTVGAMEQLGGRFQPFLDYLLAQRPAVCVHLEPIADFYRPDSAADALALLWHRQRGYLDGFVPALQALERQGRVRILQLQRPGFGCAHHESGSLVVWQPV